MKIWAAIYWYFAGPTITQNGLMAARDRVDSLGNQVPPMVQMLLPNNDASFQDDSSPTHTARCVQSWFEEQDDALQHLPWPAQSPDFKIIETLWSVLEDRVRSRFPPPSPVKQLEDVLHVEWYNIPLQTIQNLYEYIPSRLQAVLQANGGPTLYFKKEMCIFQNCLHYFVHLLYISGLLKKYQLHKEKSELSDNYNPFIQNKLWITLR